MSKVLTQRAVETAKPGAKRYGKADGLVPGQQLLVQPSGQKSFALFSRVNGKTVKVTLGNARLLTLAEARIKGRQVLASIAEGDDPRIARHAGVETFATAAGRFIERYAKVHNRGWKESERLFAREVLPHWRHRPLASIGKRDVVVLLDRVVDRGAPATAVRVLAAVRKLFNWAIERGLVDANPADRIRRPMPETKRERVLADDELKLVWRAACALPYPVGPYLKLLILTAQRRSEVAGLRWSEIDSGLTTWTLPAERAKNNTEHIIPLAQAVRELLASMPRIAGCDFVFTTTGRAALGGFARIKHDLDRAVSIAPWRLHDLRRTAATGMARMGAQPAAVERLLNHTSGIFRGVAGIYNRHNFRAEMTAALEGWAAHVMSL